VLRTALPAAPLLALPFPYSCHVGSAETVERRSVRELAEDLGAATPPAACSPDKEGPDRKRDPAQDRD
jgi:hypothetical protein